ncbi:hypothetical protein F4821DRAFT_271581 [Hypoxylon rubiginosum]|uniref:Uncharacterized protein n=1 Tax=Hypoxylon rubiginosum TaxID=110542 RepID=A0ACC0CTP8_9PEZI|nr:hypothetical protein F4821DRAFT_271581 [Hypoxylon rubiginosum]
MYYTTVGMTRESLAHLDEVSRHPLISKGIRAIKVSLGPFYDSILADDIKVFAAFRASKMRRNIERWEQGIDNQLTRPIPIEVYQGVIATAASFVRSLEEVAARGIDRIPFDHFRIAEAHTKYRQLYEEHKDFSSSFAQAITSAMVRMPTATWLKINDEKSYIYPGSTMAHMLSEALEGADSLQDFMVSPVRWEDVRKFRLGPPPFNLVGELLLSIQRLNIRLAGFYIQFPPPVASSSDTATTHEPALLRAAANQLKSIVFKPQIGWDDSWTERAPDEWADFTSFLRTILQTKSLQRINLNFYFMGNNPPPLLSMASPLLSYTWPNLETLYFHGPFHYEELKAVVEPLDRNVSLRWSGYLMSGSWIDVLDLLRGRNSLVQRLGTTFDGQEYDLMTHAERRFLFEEDEDEEYDYGYPGLLAPALVLR